MSSSPHLFCTAPLMDWSDRHCRYFWRGLSHHARLYTEMVTTGALLYGDVARHLRYEASEHPLALQLGGSEADALARCATLGEQWGYDEINLNCGCPSDRVQEGRFGACLMKEPDTVAAAVAAMRRATRLPVTVKHRIGVDDSEDYPFLRHFVLTVAGAGCETFIVHARKAWLKGLSPKENREIPPLTYEHVHRLKQEFPQLRIVINGGLKTLADCQQQLTQLDGVMLGREPYENPWMLAAVDPTLFASPAPVDSREQALRRLQPYIERERTEQGTPLAAITRHVLGLYRGQPGGRAFRRVLSERGHRTGAGWEVVEAALEAVQGEQRRLSDAA
ncbi:MAG: tRNA dihydrouridine(20/20a) synthase DusA [Nevskiaceae bacterium]|nr:MAG: tRNA dihydrouridine(20/20a) synthase DusA [Nevskiaceae bacterium]TAM26211.1 MAG: tRNA dihydrouridine(20/20a) synthase DusA [Nevskiaceae bacterium]